MIRKRHWSAVMVEAREDGFGITLDGRPLRHAGGLVVQIGSRALAEAVAGEWRLAGGERGGIFGSTDLVITALAATLQAHVEPDPPRAAALLAGYVDGEALCYRASYPAALAALQTAEWDPLLGWIAERIGAAMLVGDGVMPRKQPETVRQGLLCQLAGLSSPALTGLGVVVPALGSLVLGLALAARRIDADEAWRLGRLDEAFQARHWGEDSEAQAQAIRLRADIAVAARFIVLAESA